MGSGAADHGVTSAPRAADTPNRPRAVADPSFLPIPLLAAALPDSEAVDPALLTRMLLVRAAGRHFALPLDALCEVLPLRAATPIPGGGPAVRGLINLRGRIVTVLDLGVWVDPACAAPADPRIIVIERGATRVGLVADVERIIHVDPTQLDGSARALQTLRPGPVAVRGVGRMDRHRFGVLDADTLLDSAFA